MWRILNGTLINALTVAVGGAVGLLATGRLPERYQRILLDVLGLITITLGIDAAVIGLSDAVSTYRPAGEAGASYGARLGLLMVAALLVGAVLGTFLKLHERIEGLGAVLHRRFPGEDGKGFAQAFLTASVIFCVGPLTLLGCLKNGAAGDPSYLYIKSLLDGFCAMALAATLGMGVLASVLFILVFQGGLALLARFAAGLLDDLAVRMMNVTGGALLLATALLLLDIRKIPVANLLPAIFLPPLGIWLCERIWPGLLLTTP